VPHELPGVSAFHRALPGYNTTALVKLRQVAKEVGIGAVYVKNESGRFGQPSFKILGVSWAAFRAIIQSLALPRNSDFNSVRRALSTASVTLVTATDGNHGRSVARIGSILGTKVHVFVPSIMDRSAVEVIGCEGATITEVDGPYNLALQTASEAAKRSVSNILVQLEEDLFPGLEDMPDVSYRH
jgi:threonine dehydratase